jgi:hypothetical protein
MKLKDRTERRNKIRFGFKRPLRYKLMENDNVIEMGQGETVDISSGGIAFQTSAALKAGEYIELSIDWPALLGDTCPMRLVTFGRLIRRTDSMVACTVEKWEFRTGSRRVKPVVPMSNDARLSRWVEYRKEVNLKTAGVAAMAAVSAMA